MKCKFHTHLKSHVAGLVFCPFIQSPFEISTYFGTFFNSIPFMESLLLLPNPSNLSPSVLLFLDQHFKTQEDLSLIPSLLKKLKKDCGDSDWNLLSLKKNLSSTIASWISRSDAVDSVLHQLSLKLEDFDPAPFRGFLISFLFLWILCLVLVIKVQFFLCFFYGWGLMGLDGFWLKWRK